MKIIKAKQGTPEWHAHRANTRNASDAPAVMGVSPYKSRAALIREKATGIVPEVSPDLQRRFDKGHATEAAARLIVEEDMGITLYPLVATDDDGYLGASSDGCTLPPKGGMGFEHKLWNADLAESVRNGIVPESHAWQLDQQIAVFEFDCILFVVSDGTAENMVSCEYRTTPERIAALMAGWQQFDADVAAYQPSEEETKPILVANPIDHLPALIVEVTGMVTHSNLAEFKEAANAVIGSIKTELQTDQDFVDATAAVKYLKDVEDSAKRAKQNALDQTASIADLFRTLDEVIEMSGKVRRALDKKITDEKDRRKTELVMQAKTELADHAAALNKRIHGLLPAVACDFSAPIKGLKSLDSMKDKIAAALANAKIEANATADRIEANVALLTPEDGTNWSFLFPDLFSVANKAPDDFAAMLSSRIATHQAAEEKRLEAEREKIRKEEADKLAKEAADKAEAERQQAEKIAHANAEAAKQVQILAPHPITSESEAGTLAGARPIVAASSQAIEQHGDMVWEISGLIAQMNQAEQKLVLHYCERIIAER